MEVLTNVKDVLVKGMVTHGFDSVTCHFGGFVLDNTTVFGKAGLGIDANGGEDYFTGDFKVIFELS